MAAAALALAVAAPWLLSGCGAEFGSEFLTNTSSNVTLRGFQTVTTGSGSTTSGGSTAGGSTGGSSSAANGGATGPKGGNPTEFLIQFAPFPTQDPISVLASPGRTTTINIEVKLTGHDVNGNPRTLISYLTASGFPDESSFGGTVGVGTSSGTAAGERISTLRPTYVSRTTITSVGGTSGTSGSGQSGSVQTRLIFPTSVAARITITNGISVLLTKIRLRYFFLNGQATTLDQYENTINEFLEANPISTGFTSSSGGGQ